MAAPVGPARVRGLTELVRTFDKFGPRLKKAMRAELAEVAEPVRETAEGLAARSIRNIGPRWSQMRVGVTTRSVYIAPKTRTRRTFKRPNFASLLLERAMWPALQGKGNEIRTRVEHLFDRLSRKEGF